MEDFYSLLMPVAEQFPEISFAFSNTVEAFRKCIGFDANEIESNKLELSLELNENTLKVGITNGDIFGSQPFIGLQTKDGRYLTDNFNFGESDSKTFYYTFDFLTIPLENIKTIAVASNDKYGNTCIRRIDL